MLAERILMGLLIGGVALGCFVVLAPFLSAVLWASILTFTTWPAYAMLRAIGVAPADAAAGIASAGKDKPLIDERLRLWRFSYASPEDLAVHEAIQAAAAFLQGEARGVPGFHFPVAPIALAGLALKAHTVFLDRNAKTQTAEQLARAVVDAAQNFERA